MDISLTSLPKRAVGRGHRDGLAFQVGSMNSDDTVSGSNMKPMPNALRGWLQELHCSSILKTRLIEFGRVVQQLSVRMRPFTLNCCAMRLVKISIWISKISEAPDRLHLRQRTTVNSRYRFATAWFSKGFSSKLCALKLSAKPLESLTRHSYD